MPAKNDIIFVKYLGGERVSKGHSLKTLTLISVTDPVQVTKACYLVLLTFLDAEFHASAPDHDKLCRPA